MRELSNNDSQGDPRYTCNLCNQTAHLTEMVRHLIGRKHRQKYMVRRIEHMQAKDLGFFLNIKLSQYSNFCIQETKRPDLVTWNKRESLGGTIFKAKAEMIERQDGRGHPVVWKTFSILIIMN